MATKLELKSEVKRLKKRLKHMRKVMKIGVKTIEDRDGRIAQLTSVLEDQHMNGRENRPERPGLRQ